MFVFTSLCTKQVTVSSSAGLARFPSIQENRAGERRGDGVPGDGECSSTHHVRLLFSRTVDPAGPESSLDSSGGKEEGKMPGR